MLAGDFFYITELETNEAVTTAMLCLNAAHPIFGGHFPGQPVVPGVCMMQMVKEVAERILNRDEGEHKDDGENREEIANTKEVSNKELQLVKADHLKFLAFVVPEKNKILRMKLTLHSRENGETSVDAELLDGAVACFKFRGLFSGSGL